MAKQPLFHPVLRELLPELLGEDYNLSSLTANIAAPGGEPMPLPSDQGVHAALVADSGGGQYGLDAGGPVGGERGDAAGAGEPPVAGAARAQAGGGEHATGPAGTMLMFDRRLWHGTGANRTTRKRQTISVTNAEEARTLTPGGSPLRSDGGDCEAQPDGG